MYRPLARYLILATALALPTAVPAAWAQQPIPELLREVPLIDGHNDLPWQYFKRYGNRFGELDVAADQRALEPPLHTDLPRLRAGGVGAQFWSVYVPISEYGGSAGDAARVLAQMDVVRRLAERYPEDLELAYTAQDIRRIHASGRIASLMGVEGGHAIEDSLGVLRSLYHAGARYMTLTHSTGLRWADSATDEKRHGGLTDFGKTVVREMNRLGMLVDLSHVSEAAMHDALDVATAPVIFSHSSARGVTAHPRNVPDSVLERLGDNGGVVMVTFVPAFVSQAAFEHSASLRAEAARLRTLHPGDPDAVEAALETWKAANPDPGASLADVADHIDHIRDIAGIEHIGLGGDFDGITSVPRGLEDVSSYPALLAELRGRDYSDDDLKAIAGGNVLRVMERAESRATALQQEGLSSDKVLAVVEVSRP